MYAHEINEWSEIGLIYTQNKQVKEDEDEDRMRNVSWDDYEKHKQNKSVRGYPILHHKKALKKHRFHTMV